MSDLMEMLWKGSLETLYMTVVATAFVLLGGVPLGVLLVATDRGGIWEQPVVNKLLGSIVNIVRSAPFIILMVALVSVTRFIVGTTIGTTASIVPMVIAAIPFMGRVVEQGLREVDPGLVEAATAMGTSSWQMIGKVLIPEALPSLIRGTALTIISLIGLGAMAGAVGGGGLGAIAVTYGYMRFQTDVMLGCLVVLLLLVQIIQFAGDRLAAAVTHK